MNDIFTMLGILLVGLSLILLLLISVSSIKGQKGAMALEINTRIVNGNLDNDSLLTTKQVVYNSIIKEIVEKNQTVDKYQATKKEGESNQTNNDTIRKLRQEFCGLEAKPHSNPYVTEYVLPQICEMPLGIAVDSHAKKVWYVSTKKGVLGSYNLKENKFDEEHAIPEWKAREDPSSYSQVWDVKVDPNSRNVWFTDEKGNAIWRYIKSSQKFEIYKVPGNSQYFGTIYPISIEFVPSNDNRNNNNNNNNKIDGNTIFLVGTYSQSLWYADVTKLKNGTSEGISQISLPIANEFKKIDPIYITTGSLTYDSKRHVVWIPIMAYSKKGQILRYNLDTKTFDTFDLPKELNSPLGMAVDDHSGDLWVTNAGTSIFYKFKPHDRKDNDNNNTSIVKFATSKASSRIFSDTNGMSGSKDNNDKITNISKHAYTLPYWIKKSGESLWFNEWEGNKIARFDPSHSMLIEYWIPSQNRLWGICSSFDNTMNSSANNNNNTQETCGIANVLQLAVEKRESNNNDNNDNDNIKAKQIWFTEWSENKIGKIDVSDSHPPFSVEVSHLESDKKELTIKRGESEEIKIKVKATGSLSSSFSAKDEDDNNIINMIAAGTFTSTGDLGNSTGYFNKNSFRIDTSKKKVEEITFDFTPSADLKPGKYTLMIGAENNAVSLLKAISLKIG